MTAAPTPDSIADPSRRLAPVLAQIDRLAGLGVPALAGMSATDFRALGTALTTMEVPEDALVVINPNLVAPSLLTPLLRRGGKAGFVVEDMTDVDEFTSIPTVDAPSAQLYLATAVERGDDMLNWSPEEALAAFAERARSPLTLSEGISWLLQQPEMLAPGKCFMCIGSRKPKPDGALDSRVPALWISGGTGRDGRERKGAPKVGWCWARNRHTWLGFASAGRRLG
ncbi:hypothetical protein SAMN06309944_2323 [Micrococcales bacterium KH10]|nr:hypothetical protein SAMN06309944_2323 [Micrococcales bacterium KH10]